MVEIEYFTKKLNEWRREIYNHRYLILLSVVLVIIASAINYTAGFYVSYKASVVDVPDLVLDHFGPYNLRILFVWGWLFLFLFVFLYILFFKVKKLHYAIMHFSLLTIVRAIFVIFTHLQTPVDAVSGAFPGILNLLKFRNDQFFSGHVAVFFLGFLLFRENKKMSYFFLISSIVMAITVLGMHQHYSIDVFAAFFITYGCYKIGDWLLKKLKILRIE